jgi:ActR/RegA family two-component response regulator
MSLIASDRAFEKPPLEFSISSEPRSLYRSSLRVLKKVSGKLSRILQWTKEPEPRSDPLPKHLLVVDDEESICFSMSEYFSHHGFAVDTAKEIDEAEQLIRSKKYAVIVQDLRLGTSHNDGLEIVRFVREASPDTRIVVLTAYGSMEIEDETMRTGADAFLRKPKPLSQVAQVIQGLIDSPSRYGSIASY